MRNEDSIKFVKKSTGNVYFAVQWGGSDVQEFLCIEWLQGQKLEKLLQKRGDKYEKGKIGIGNWIVRRSNLMYPAEVYSWGNFIKHFEPEISGSHEKERT